MILNIIFYKQYKHIGLTASTSIAAMVNYLILLASLKKRYININIYKYVKFVITAIFASMIAYYISKVINVPRIGKFEVIVKIFIFGIVYLSLWAYPFYKKRINLFN